jgi:hypothetical protein
MLVCLTQDYKLDSERRWKSEASAESTPIRFIDIHAADRGRAGVVENATQAFRLLVAPVEVGRLVVSGDKGWTIAWKLWLLLNGKRTFPPGATPCRTLDLHHDEDLRRF